MARHDAPLGWPFALASVTVLASLTLGTFTIWGKNWANLFYVPGSHQFESVGPAAAANLAAQLLLALVVGALALIKPVWRSTGFVLIPLANVTAFLALNAWAQTSVPHS